MNKNVDLVLKARRVGFGIVFSALLLLQPGSWQPTQANAEAAQKPAISKLSLSRDEAVIRSNQVSRVSYLLWFGLDSEQDQFTGKTVIQFNLRENAKKSGRPLLIDLEEGTVTSLSINGNLVPEDKLKDRFDGHHVVLQMKELQEAANQIKISYTHPYSATGNGLHRFKDPVDNRVYINSHFEPYYAHRMFPCFDQPDIKATYELTVEAPNDWTVISNTLETKVATVDGRKTWNFPPTTPLSTYIVALHAGPYASWKSVAKSVVKSAPTKSDVDQPTEGKAKVDNKMKDDEDTIPLRLFSRQSLAKYIDYQEWFKVTQDGLEFFATQFGYAYPFSKYDQLLVPDFNSGAMENAGAVTFSEKFIFRSKVTSDKHRRRAEVILHEMAHMWFGDLVTMRWWNGLWLNESFATFMAAWAVNEATKYPGSWQSFFTSAKQWAYWEDQLVTTHPIEVHVPSTDQAEAGFDGITYGKGASSLKQLSFFLGEADFKEGLQRYFQKYAFRTTTITDFMKTMSEAAALDLNSWQHAWLQTSGINTIRVAWECAIDPDTDANEISKFTLVQSSEGLEPGENLRPHRTKIAFYRYPKKQKRGPLVLDPSHQIGVTYTAAVTEVPEAVGEPCPDFVFPNLEDYDHVKIDLDPKTLTAIHSHLGQIEHPLTRQMLWHVLWEMVVDGKMRAQDYASMVFAQAGNEKSTLILSQVLLTLANPSSTRQTVIKFLDPSLRPTYQAKIEAFIQSHLTTAPAGSDLQLIWYSAFLEAADTASALKFAAALLQKPSYRGLVIDQERRWEILQALARHGNAGVSELIQAELKKDPTDMGQRAAITAEASLPDAAIKTQWFQRLAQPSEQDLKTYSYAKLRAAMSRFNTVGQEELIKKTASLYFQALPKLVDSSSAESSEYSAWFASAMFPALCSADNAQQAKQLISSHPDWPARIVRSLKINHQEEERCIRARKKSEEGRK